MMWRVAESRELGVTIEQIAKDFGCSADDPHEVARPLPR